MIDYTTSVRMAEDHYKGYQHFYRNRRRLLRILVAVDGSLDSESFLSILSEMSTDVELVRSGDELLNHLMSGDFDFIFMDRRMPGLRGEVALWLADGHAPRGVKTPVVFFSESEDERVLLPLKQFAIEGVWEKRTLLRSLEAKVRLSLDCVRSKDFPANV